MMTIFHSFPISRVQNDSKLEEGDVTDDDATSSARSASGKDGNYAMVTIKVVKVGKVRLKMTVKLAWRL